MSSRRALELKAKVAASQSSSLATQLVTMDRSLVTQMVQSGAQLKEIRAAVVGKTNRPLKREEREYIDDAIESFAEQRAAAEEERRQNLHTLIQDNDADLISKFFGPLLPAERNYHANRDRGSFGPPLVWAIRNGRAYICQVLIRNGADRDVKFGPHQMPVLVLAVQENQQRCLETLHNCGCSTEEVDIRGQTALITAAEIGRTLLVKELCVRGANVDAVDKDGATPLIKAALVGQLECVSCLIDYGASLECADQLGRTALIAAALSGGEHTLMHGRETVALLLDRGAMIEAHDHGGDTALLAAIRGGSVETAQLLLMRGANHGHVSNDGDTALHRAASKRLQITPFSAGEQAQLTEMICRANAVVDQKGLDGDSALYRAASTGNRAVVDILIEANADVNLQTYHGETAAMACVLGACRKGSKAATECMRSLAGSESVDWSRTNECGVTVLMMAAELAQIEIVDMLLDSTADPRAVDNLGNTALLYAARSSEPAVVRSIAKCVYEADDEALEWVNIDDKTALHVTSQHGDEESVETLLQLGAIATARDCMGAMPIHCAAAGGKTETIRVLLERYPGHVDIPDDNGSTPLVYAARRGQLEAVETLCAAGADCNILNAAGESPMVCAIQAGFPSVGQFFQTQSSNNQCPVS